MSERYKQSELFLARAEKSIPLGSQTFSKSKTQYPFGSAPFFIKRGAGSKVWDLDGNEYIDFVNSLCAVTLGYNDPDVTTAVSEQLKEGVIFSLPHTIETEVAEKIIEMVPCAEKVRFGKNGSDATSGAVRVARAYTKHDRIAVCGYHGWQDWYIGSTLRNAGVPNAVRELTHPFTYNDISSLEKLFAQYPGEFAAVILEPMNVYFPKPGFLEELKTVTHKAGALLVFDETITGFRFANGGAQEKFGVTPDLACFGKGLANGYPVAAIAGKNEVMKEMENIFFSFTFGGETLSLAAAKATLTKLQKEPVIDTIWKTGTKVMQGLESLIQKHSLGATLTLGGAAPWSFLIFKDTQKYSQWQLKTLFLQEVLARGILTVGTNNISYAHSDADVQKFLKVYDEVFAILAAAQNLGDLEKRLACKVLEPLFKLR